MQKLYKKLENYTLKDALEIEKQDLQYKALENLFKEINNENIFYSLVLTNSIICYQLSSSWEKYWQEFSLESSKYFNKKNVKSNEIIEFFYSFLPNSKGNKRFIETKLKRLEKIRWFLEEFFDNYNLYLKDLVNLKNKLALNLNQKNDAKTIVFAIKMLWYSINIVYEYKLKNWLSAWLNPKNISLSQISIPIDSRLTNIFEIYCENYKDIKKFYKDLWEKLNIPEINLDAILWVNYEKLIKS